MTLGADFVTSTNGVLAVKGSGKSYWAMAVAEEMLEADLPFAALDPTGAWWGLLCGADGDPKRGYSLLMAGGDKGHVELEAVDGRAVAEWMVRHYPAQVLCDLSLLTPDEQHQFGYDFASTLYFRNRRAVHVFVDEVDELCSQRPQSSMEQKCVGAFDRLVRRGRIRGIGLTGITQRSAVWSKNMLTQVGSLMVLKTSGPQDLDAIEAWVSRVMSKEQVRTFLASLGKLKRGEAWYISPGRDPMAQKVKVRKKRTYDSSRTPQVGEEVVDPVLREPPPGARESLLEMLREGRREAAAAAQLEDGET